MHTSRSCTQTHTFLDLLNYYTLVTLVTLHYNYHTALSNVPLIHAPEISGSNLGLKSENSKWDLSSFCFVCPEIKKNVVKIQYNTIQYNTIYHVSEISVATQHCSSSHTQPRNYMRFRPWHIIPLLTYATNHKQCTRNSIWNLRLLVEWQTDSSERWLRLGADCGLS